MIHISNYINNIIYSAITLPTNYTLVLINNQNKQEYQYAMINYLTTNTQSEITFTNLLPGEYTYKLISDDALTIYEIGLAKLAPTIEKSIISHKSGTKYKIYGQN